MLSARFLGVALVSLTMGCPRSDMSNRDTPASEWHYEVRLAPDLATIEATVCFEGDVPRALRPGKDEAAYRLRQARWLSPGPTRKLPVVGGQIRLDDAPRDGCLQYRVSLAEGGSLDAAVRPVGRDLMASPSTWLWRPERRAVDARADLTLTLPPGVRAALPWPKRDGRYLLDAAAFRFESYAAFGRFEPRETTHGGVALSLAVLDGDLALGHDELVDYLAAGMAKVTARAGQFPAQRLSVIVLPIGSAAEPVPFGMMARGGGASLFLMMSGDARARALRDDWVLPHELSHLLLPFIVREDAFLSEGFATYYQELLRAHPGGAGEQASIAGIVRNMRAVQEDPGEGPLAAQSAQMRQTQAYREVYWAGAAFWLKLDVALRTRSQQHLTLDSLTATLRATYDGGIVWTAESLCAALDRLSESDLFSQALAEARARAVPEFEQTLTDLGVRTNAGVVTLDDAAPGAAIRRALFAPRPGETSRSPAPPARAGSR